MRQTLIIEDNPADATLLELTLEASGFRSEITVVPSIDAATSHLDSADLIFCDLGLPDAAALSSIFDLRLKSVTVPIIVVSASDVGRSAVEWGATGFISKGVLRGQRSSELRSILEAICASETTGLVWESESSVEPVKIAIGSHENFEPPMAG